jgi:hypothetical protein
VRLEKSLIDPTEAVVVAEARETLEEDHPSD